VELQAPAPGWPRRPGSGRSRSTPAATSGISYPRAVGTTVRRAPRRLLERTRSARHAGGTRAPGGAFRRVARGTTSVDVGVAGAAVAVHSRDARGVVTTTSRGVRRRAREARVPVQVIAPGHSACRSAPSTNGAHAASVSRRAVGDPPFVEHPGRGSRARR
jgi:hypothetical protein